METIVISSQKAVALCKKHCGGVKVPPLNESYLMPHGVKLYNGIIYSSMNGKDAVHGRCYFLSGYAQDNSDIKAFCKENNIKY